VVVDALVGEDKDRHVLGAALQLLLDGATGRAGAAVIGVRAWITTFCLYFLLQS
jgi:hypothetical protein